MAKRKKGEATNNPLRALGITYPINIDNKLFKTKPTEQEAEAATRATHQGAQRLDREQVVALEVQLDHHDPARQAVAPGLGLANALLDALGLEVHRGVGAEERQAAQAHLVCGAVLGEADLEAHVRGSFRWGGTNVAHVPKVSWSGIKKT